MLHLLQSKCSCRVIERAAYLNEWCWISTLQVKEHNGWEETEFCGVPRRKKGWERAIFNANRNFGTIQKYQQIWIRLLATPKTTNYWYSWELTRGPVTKATQNKLRTMLWWIWLGQNELVEVMYRPQTQGTISMTKKTSELRGQNIQFIVVTQPQDAIFVVSHYPFPLDFLEVLKPITFCRRHFATAIFSNMWGILHDTSKGFISPNGYCGMEWSRRWPHSCEMTGRDREFCAYLSLTYHRCTGARGW